MKPTSAHRPNLADDLDLLIGDLCTQYGFCNWLFGVDLLEIHPNLTASEFAKAILVAEKMVPETELDWLRLFKRKFVERYGGEAINASDYRLEYSMRWKT